MKDIAKHLRTFLGVAALSVGVAAANTVVFPAETYFTLAPDGESYNGTAIPIGGTNPTPIGATLSGMYTPTTVSVSSGSVTILPTFSVTLSDSPTLMDGDFAILDATDGTNIYPVGVLSWDLIFPGNAGQFDILNLTGANSLAPDFPISTTVNLSDLTLTVNFAGVTAPEPGTWMLLITGLVLLTFAQAWLVACGSKATGKTPGSNVAKCLLPAVCLLAAGSAFGQVHLATGTVPSSGVAGVTNVSVLGSGFPSGTIIPKDIVVTLSTSCGGAAAATSTGNSITKILGSTYRVNFNIPGGITTGTYFVTIADTTTGDADFTTNAGSCSALQVTGSSAILNACVAGSSMGVLLPSGGAAGNITAYVPKGFWSGGTTGVFVQNIEGAINPTATVATPNIPNSCSSNPATGQTVCVANNTDVYLISGTTLTNTLSSSSNARASFSGGSCNNCGVALNAANNTAVINMGFNGDGVQILNLTTNTFNPAFHMTQNVSENISVDPTRSLILSANESGNYPILQLQSDGSLKEFDSAFSTGAFNDSSAEDCSTGVAITPDEGTTQLQLVNMNNITFGASTYTAPNAIANLSSGISAYTFSAGLSGSAVAQGSGHLAVVTGEFGGNTFAVLQLPATPGTGAPALADFAIAQVPSNPACGGTFSAGFDPHTITAYTSPNTGHAYAVFAGYSAGIPACLAVVDMTIVINPSLSPRGGAGFGSHEISPAHLPASAVTFFAL
jgi:hypothetical protein